MRVSRTAFLSIPLAFVLFGFPVRALGQASDSRPGIAVLPFDVTQIPPTDLAEAGLNFGLQQMLVTDLEANSALRIVDRRSLNDVMQELDLDSSGRVDGETAARIGRIVGARYMIGAAYFDNSGDVRLDARIIDVETTEVISTARVNDERDHLFDLTGELAEAITSEVDLPPLPEAVREERRAHSVPMEAIELYTYAVASDEAGEMDEAMHYLDMALERWPEYADAAALKGELASRSGV